MHSMLRLAAAAVTLIAATAQAQNGEPPPVTAVKLAPGEVIRMDGSLSDPVWRRAPAHKEFMQREPNYGQPTPYDTWMQVAYDDRYVYVGITAFDPKPELIRDPPVRHDLVLRTQDHVIVYIDPIGKKQSAQFFRISASGSTADGMQTASDDSEDFAPDFDFDAKAQRNEKGYTFVLRVPFASLRYTNDQSRPWRIMAARRVPRDQFYWNPSVPIPLDSPNILVNMQELRGIEVPKESNFVTLRPSVTLSRTRTQDAPSPVEKEKKLKPTLDFKWRASPELVVDGTIKPDFSQLDLDVPQLGGNSRFALFYPEKRPFFFEASDVMRSPTDALYTRSFTEPNWGLRATWRGTTHAGTAMAVDDKGGGLVMLPGPYATNYADQPGSRTIAARELADVGPLQIGGVLAARRYENGIGDNIVAGPDLAWQVNDSLRIRAQWLHSSTTAQPDAAGVLQKGSTTQGNRLYLRAVNQRENDAVDVTLFDNGEGFRHDTGFVPQVGVRGFESRFGFVKRQFSVFNEMWFNFRANYTRDRVTGETVKADPFVDIYFSSTRNQQATLELHGFSKVRSASGAPLLHEKYISGTYSVTPVTWIPLIDSNFAIGRLGDMFANEVRPGARGSIMVRTRPLKQLEIEPRLSSAVLYKDGKQTYRETAATLNAIWFFDANRSIRAILQRTLLDRLPEPGVFEEHDRAKVASVTYTWRRSMGTVLYVGASVQKGRFPLPSLSRGTEAFVKLQVDYDELKRGLL
ncbi:carbohydrate binding family 9 domain-containing protein [Ramlibacter sp. PS4R-6]|uniref:carbohydrate binding family 9 domain-containing protein n=1 Tax=Ramlibacter sp. PS4R-6 TaxID=3133438 RepID=UPI00309B6C92